MTMESESPRTIVGAIRKRIGGELDKLVEAWLLWVTVGATAGVLMLSPTLQDPAEFVPAANPSAADIEHAVARAEAEGIAAGARIRPRAR